MEFTASVEYIRRTFFPDWDKGRQWQVVQVDDLDGAQGHASERPRPSAFLMA